MENRKKSVGTAPFMIGLVLFVVLFSAASSVAVKYGIKLASSKTASYVSASGEKKKYVAVIDAGHGGEDGGCSSGNILEKDLNLDVSKRVAGLCALLGVETEMTRTDDTLLYDMYDDMSDYTGKKKMYDLKNRVRFTKEAEADAYVAIHMNKFPSQSCDGMQIYYAESENGSLALAESIRAKNIEAVGESGSRELKKGKNSIFVLAHAECPAVLVECGFLSNPGDLEKLTSEEGKLETALVIALGLFESSKSADT